jgi:hypothetical protein
MTLTQGKMRGFKFLIIIVCLVCNKNDIEKMKNLKPAINKKSAIGRQIRKIITFNSE